jgi:hypothetical protein
MNKGQGLSVILLGVFVAACLGMTFFMPWSELGFMTSAEPTGTWVPLMNFVNSTGLSGLLAVGSGAVCGILNGIKSNPDSSYYIYSFFCGLALIAAAFGINVIGREDAEEKTVLPQK